MSRKIKSTNLQLGIIQIWNSVNQNFGILNGLYKKNYLLKTQIIYYFSQALKKVNILSNIELFYFKKYIQCNFYFINIKDLQLFLISLQKNLYTYYIYKIKVRCFLQCTQIWTSIAFINYFCVIFKNTKSLKKTNILLISLLNNQIAKVKSLNLKQGPIKIKLIGYKLCLKGRFENTKNQMAKKQTFKNGKVCLNSLNYYIDFNNKVVYSKLGTFNISIWLFYKILY